MESCRYRKCVICGIRNLPKSSTAVLASFPLDPDRCRLWVKASGIEDFVHVPIEKLHQSKYVCGSHFAPECFNSKGNRLPSSAVPTLRLNRPLLSDGLFAEFPLHVKSNYAKFEKGESSKHRQSEILPVETIPKVTKDSDDQALNLSDKKVIATVNKLSGSDDFIPIPSTSKAPMHLTFKRKEAHALSNTMAAVLKMMAASSNSNADDYNNTAFVVEEMDKLFNWTNGPASPKDVLPRKRENVLEKKPAKCESGSRTKGSVAANIIQLNQPISKTIRDTLIKPKIVERVN
ncbi:hypothetical protein PYW07_004008 [Mythimna separata]|uniref:THAP-type domain-containing protein n=1 Tax=Mythimna separata TaxID=271217 RepID=A0AAD7YP99_MYTSE|nr:hypothetical protein PYW07_004008 [Mythimna separata]